MTITMRNTKAEIFAAYSAAIEPEQVKKHRPIERMEIVRLVACGTVTRLAEWVIDRYIGEACAGDHHAAETVAAVKVYLAANELVDDGEQAAGRNAEP